MTDLSLTANNTSKISYSVSRHLNKLRWMLLACVFAMLILLPLLHLYQSYLASNSYNLLSSGEQFIHDSMEAVTSPFTDAPEHDLDNFKGTTWTGTLFGIQLSDPLAVVTNFFASAEWDTAFFMTALVPILLTVIFGRFFCGWVCPATFLYELNDNLGTWLHKLGFPVARRQFDLRLKYLVLLACLVLTIPLGAVLISSMYPPAVIGREFYFAIAKGGFSVGILFILFTLLFELLVARRGFCRYLCPGGALYSLLGRFRLVRIQRNVSQCNDCAKCNTACQFGLDPMHDRFGQDCNNCTACIAICPTSTLQLTSSFKDLSYQGPGHIGPHYRIQLGTKD